MRPASNDFTSFVSPPDRRGALPGRSVGKPLTGGFTLIELLVVIGIIGMLAALLLPALSSSKQSARKAACLSNLRQIGIAIQMYADDHAGRIPFGPKAPPFTSPASFYPATGSPTSLLSLRHGTPVGLGLLLEQYLASTPRVLFCPGADQPLNAAEELARVGVSQAQGSYFYRHAGNTRMFDEPGSPPVQTVRLTNLGRNREGAPIRVLVLDTQFLCPPDLEVFNVLQRTHHQQKVANALLWDGGARSLGNRDRRFTVDLRDYAELHDAFNKILATFERADVAP